MNISPLVLGNILGTENLLYLSWNLFESQSNSSFAWMNVSKVASL